MGCKIIFYLLILLFSTLTINAAPVADAGPNRTTIVNRTISLDGSASQNAFDGWRPINVSSDHAIKWDFGFGGFQHQGSLIAPIAYPVAGTYIATLTICDSSDVCAIDVVTVTVSSIPACVSEIILIDSGNSITNMANLQSEVNSSANLSNRCITLPITAIFRGKLILAHRPSSTFLTIRTANYALLPEGKRVSLSDASNMPKMENAVSGSNNGVEPIIDTPTTSSNPAQFYNIVGIHIRKAIESLPYVGLAMVSIGKNNETSLAQLPNNIIVDRCILDGSTSTTNTWRGLMFDASDSTLANSHLYGFKGVSLETQAVLQSMGERNNYYNNFIEGATENFMSGGLGIAITNHVPSDFSFRRNYLKKNLAWCAVCGQYGGIDYAVKNLFELKVGQRIGIEANVFENHWLEDQNNAIVLTPRNSSSTKINPWVTIQHIWFAYNKIINFGEGIQILGTDNLAPSQTMNHVAIVNNQFSGTSKWNGRHLLIVMTSGNTIGGADRISFRQNSTDQNGDIGNGHGRFIDFSGSSGFTNCNFDGNIVQGHINFNGSITGNAALQSACSTTSFSAKKNGFYRSLGTNPTDNTTVATINNVGYTDILNANLTLLPSSTLLTTGIAGNRSGIDSNKLSVMTVGTVSGVWNVRKCNWHTLIPCS